MKERLQKIKEEAIARIKESKNPESLNDVRVSVLGKKGELTALLKSMKDVAPEERPVFGQLVMTPELRLRRLWKRRKKIWISFFWMQN